MSDLGNCRMPANAADPFAADLKAIRRKAELAALIWDNVNDACPYPFGTIAGQVFKIAFLDARAWVDAELGKYSNGVQP